MNDLIQTGFDYAALPVESVDRLKTVKRDIAIIDKLACVQIGQKLKEAQSELNMRGKKGAGFQEWVEAETPYALTAAYEMMRIADRFGENDMRNSAHHFSYSVLARLSAPSTPESVVEKAIEKAESGAKVTVADVKDWKAELDAATQRCEEFRQESNERRKTIRTLEEQIDLLKAQPTPEPEKIIVAPDDYEIAKAKAAQLETELANLKKEQATLINNQVKAKLHERQAELDKLEQDKQLLDEVVSRKKAYLASIDSDIKRIETHQKVIEENRLHLISLAAFLSDEEPVQDADTRKRWNALADMLAEAMTAVRQYAGDARPALSVVNG